MCVCVCVCACACVCVCVRVCVCVCVYLWCNIVMYGHSMAVNQPVIMFLYIKECRFGRRVNQSGLIYQNY